jgi:hypothetical protein
MMRNFPFRYYDIVKDLVVDGKEYICQTNRLMDVDGSEVSKEENPSPAINVTIDSLVQSKIFFAPGDLGSRILNSSPRLITSDMIKTPFDNVFIEFANPISGFSYHDGDRKIYGIHILEVFDPRVTSGRFIVMVKWGKIKSEPNVWASAIFTVCSDRTNQISDGRYTIDGKAHKVESDTSSFYLRHLSFLMFLNSSNISYEIRQAPKQPRSKDKSWWRKEYESKFEELVVKDVPKRIALSLRRNESGAGWNRSTFVRGHFKVLSYCGVCGLRRAILRFLKNEICKCGSPLNAETAKTRTFWWEGHWAGPDIVDKVIVGKA